MRRQTVLLMLILAMAVSGCIFRKRNSGRVDTRVTLIAIEEALADTFLLLEETYQSGFVARSSYESSRRRLAAIVKRYNVLVRLRGDRKAVDPADLNTIMEDIGSVADRIQKWRNR